MRETARLRLQAEKANRLSHGLSDLSTIRTLQDYACECSLAADRREADIEGVAWDLAHP